MIHQLNVLVSFPVEVKVKPVPSCAVIDTWPGVPPVVFLAKKIRAVELQAVVATVTAPGVPDMTPEVPAEAFEPVGTMILLPAVPMTRLPFVAVIAPDVAVIVVPAVTLPLNDGEPEYAGTTPTPPLMRACPVATSAIDPTTFEAVPTRRAPAATVAG